MVNITMRYVYETRMLCNTVKKCQKKNHERKEMKETSNEEIYVCMMLLIMISYDTV